MAIIYKSHSVAAAVEDSLLLPRPLGTMVLVQATGRVYYSTAAGAATYNGINIDGDVNIPVGDTLSFDETDVVFTPDGANVNVSGTGAIRFVDNFFVSFGAGDDWLMASDGTDVNWSGNARIRFNDGALSFEPNGIDCGERLVLTETFNQRPLLPAALAFPEANKDWMIEGTNAVNSVFHDVGGGIRLLTGALANDQMILRPHTAGGVAQSQWQEVQWRSNGGLLMRTVFSTVVITDTRLGLGFKILPATLDNGTDVDQCWLGYDSAGALGGVAANFVLVTSVTGADTQVDLGLAVAPATLYRIILRQLGDRTVQCYINGVLRGTSAALSAVPATTMKPFAGVQPLGAAARAITVKRIVCGIGLGT